MDSIFQRDIDKDNFLELINIIKLGKTVSFVGAGLSMLVGYRSWKEVILGSFKNGKLVKDGLLQSVDINIDDYREQDLEDLLQIAQDCKVKNPKVYSDFIMTEFDRINSTPNWHSNHSILWKCPFNSIITTNYDPSLYDSGTFIFEKEIKVYTIPQLTIPLEKGSLYYLHGIAFPTEPPINNIETVILSKSEYEDSYSWGGPIFRFLTFVLQNHNLLFLGFSFKDQYFKLLTKNIMELLKKEINIAEKIHKRKFNLKKHFLFIRDDEISLSDEQDLLEYNIVTIRFTGKNTDDYSSLHLLIRRLYEETTGMKASYPTIQTTFEDE